MVKVLPLLTFILFAQAAYANDFLRSGKQVLICHDETHFRVNWEDFELEGKSYSVRTRNFLTSYFPEIIRDGVDDSYTITEKEVEYIKGKARPMSSGSFSLGPTLTYGSTKPHRVSYHYIDKDLVDSEIQKVCKK
jgi:hypothetical protein